MEIRIPGVGIDFNYYAIKEKHFFSTGFLLESRSMLFGNLGLKVNCEYKGI